MNKAFFSCFEGNPNVLKAANSADRTTASLSPTGKGYLKSFLSDPNASDLWKIDDPVIFNNEPAIPHNDWVRGLVAELDVFKRQYKALGYTHHPTTAGYDFSGPAWVQIKSTKNPNGAVTAMRKAINDLVAKSPDAPTPLKLHILKKPGTDSQTLEVALLQHADQQGILSRFELQIDPYNIGPQ